MFLQDAARAHTLRAFLPLPPSRALTCVAPSRASLAFLQSIQAPEGDIVNLGLSARGRIPFQLAAVFVDERVATGIPSGEADKIVAEVSSICSDSGVSLRVEKLENIFGLPVSPARTEAPSDRASPSEGWSAQRWPQDNGEAQHLAGKDTADSASRDELAGGSASHAQDVMTDSTESRSKGGAAVPGEAHCVPRDADGPASAAEQLRHLLSLVHDQTAAEDLVTSLRMELLQMVCSPSE